uniref:Reverse transcriptase domain-containing protein n=3 Tax=Arion vulgaris TaxID=1028688 RepID=A0A0B7BH62_9EUPU
MVEEAETPRLLCKILNDIWDKEIIPEECRICSIIKLPKKGDLGNCNNWRGIILLSLTSKIFSRVILQRMKVALDNKIRIEQAGFRKGRSCIDHIFALRQIVEQSNEWNSSIYMVFVDFEKAFDSLHRESLWKILRHYGIPIKMVSVIKALYTDFQCQVVCNSQLTEWFEVNTGVRQGSILSPFLFNLAMD